VLELVAAQPSKDVGNIWIQAKRARERERGRGRWRMADIHIKNSQTVIQHRNINICFKVPAQDLNTLPDIISARRHIPTEQTLHAFLEAAVCA